MKRVLIVSIVSKYSKYPLLKIWVSYHSAEKLAKLLNCEVVDYRCGHGDPSAYHQFTVELRLPSRHNKKYPSARRRLKGRHYHLSAYEKWQGASYSALQQYGCRLT